MTYSTFIGQLRTQVGDTRRRVHVNWVGDAITTIFQMPTDTFPIFDQVNTILVRRAGSIITEGTDFTLDRETGTLVMNVVPAVGETLTIDCSAVYLLDSTWLLIINDVIRSLGDDFWKEFVDEDNLKTTANMLSIPLSPHQEGCIAVYDFWYRPNNSVNWSTVENFTNWRYDRENNRIYIGDKYVFGASGEPLKIRGLKAYTLGTNITNAVDVQDRFLTIIEYGAVARYWRYRYKNVVELVSKLSTEPSRTPLQELIMLSDRFDRLYEIEKTKLKPQKPPRIIPQNKDGGGRP